MTPQDYVCRRDTGLNLLAVIRAEADALTDLLHKAAHIRHPAGCGEPYWLRHLYETQRLIAEAKGEAFRNAIARVAAQ